MNRVMDERFEDEVLALQCPECGGIVWDLPHASKLAKCWNAEGHASGAPLAFDTMPDEEDDDVSEIRQYLEQEAKTPSGWLRREPRETHPAILAAVREALATLEPSPGGVIYDDWVERVVNGLAGDLPPHSHHGAEDRDPLVTQLGHEVYIARGIIRDEESTAAIMAALDEGYVQVEDAEIRAGRRYIIRPGVLYSGYAVPQYGKPREVRAVEDGKRIVFLPKGARTRGFLPVSPMLVKEVAR